MAETETADAVETPELAAVPPVEQEQEAVPEGDEAPDSGAQQSEAEAPKSAADMLLEVLDEAEESDPDLAKQIKEKLGIKDQGPDVEQERLDFERERSGQSRLQYWQNANAQAQQFTPQVVQQNLAQFFNELNAGIHDAASRLHRGEIDSPDYVGMDVQGVVQNLMGYFQGAQGAAANLERAMSHYSAFDSLQKHPTYALLTREERGQFQQLMSQNRIAEAQALQLSAAERAAPEVAAKKAAEQAKKDAGLMEKADKLASTLRNGTRPSQGGRASSVPQTREEIEEALRSGPVADIDKNMRRLAELTGE